MRLGWGAVPLSVFLAMTGGCAVYRAPDAGLTPHRIHHWRSSVSHHALVVKPATVAAKSKTPGVSVATASASDIAPAPSMPAAAGDLAHTDATALAQAQPAAPPATAQAPAASQVAAGGSTLTQIASAPAATTGSAAVAGNRSNDGVSPASAVAAQTSAGAPAPTLLAAADTQAANSLAPGKPAALPGSPDGTDVTGAVDPMAKQAAAPVPGAIETAASKASPADGNAVPGAGVAGEQVDVTGMPDANAARGPVPVAVASLTAETNAPVAIENSPAGIETSAQATEVIGPSGADTTRAPNAASTAGVPILARVPAVVGEAAPGAVFATEFDLLATGQAVQPVVSTVAGQVAHSTFPVQVLPVLSLNGTPLRVVGGNAELAPRFVSRDQAEAVAFLSPWERRVLMGKPDLDGPQMSITGDLLVVANEPSGLATDGPVPPRIEAYQSMSPTLAAAAAMASRTNVATAPGVAVTASLQPAIAPQADTLAAAGPLPLFAADTTRSFLPASVAAAAARGGIVVTLLPTVTAGLEPTEAPSATTNTAVLPATVETIAQSSTSIAGLPLGPRINTTPGAMAAAVKLASAGPAVLSPRKPLNFVPVTIMEQSEGGLLRATGGTEFHPLPAMGRKIADQAAAGPANSTVVGKTATGVTPCGETCAQSQPVSAPADESVGPAPEDAAAAPKVETDTGWGATLAGLWTSGLVKLGLASDPKPANAETTQPALAEMASDTDVSAEQPRLHKTLPPGLRLSALGPGYDGKPLAVDKGVRPQLDEEGAARIDPTARIERVSTGASQDGSAGEPLSKTVAVNTVELSDSQLIQPPDIMVAEARFDAGASPIAPFGATPAGYDLRGFQVEVVPTSNDKRVSDCAISLSQGRAGDFKVTSLAGSVPVAMGKDANEATDAAPSNANPAVKPKHKAPKVAGVPQDPAPADAPSPLQAVMVISKGNRPFLEVDFPGGAAGAFPPPWSCRYWLEITPPSCKLMVVSHRAKIAGSQSILETNAVGKCQIARLLP